MTVIHSVIGPYTENTQDCPQQPPRTQLRVSAPSRPHSALTESESLEVRPRHLHFSAGDTRPSQIPAKAPWAVGWQLGTGPLETESSFLFHNQYHTTVSLERSSLACPEFCQLLAKKIQRLVASHAWRKVRQPAVSPAGVFPPSLFLSPAPIPLPTFRHVGAGAGFLGRALVYLLPPWVSLMQWAGCAASSQV